jgi:hypothetical protein
VLVDVPDVIVRLQESRPTLAFVLRLLWVSRGQKHLDCCVSLPRSAHDFGTWLHACIIVSGSLPVLWSQLLQHAQISTQLTSMFLQS